MISKKDALTLGMLAIGGVGAAMVIGGGNGAPGALEGAKARAGGILGAQEGYGAPGTTVYTLPAQPSVTFPEAPLFDISRFLAPQAEPVSRGAAGVSAAPKKTPTTVSPAAKAILTPKAPGIGVGVMPSGETGFAPHPVYIPGVGYGMGIYPIDSGGGGGAAPTTGAAKKAVSHAKRLRAGRGD